MKTPKILTDVAAYYSAKLAEHGETARGVDWNGEESQVLRFAQLCRVIDRPQGFSITDMGCGYGALLDYLQTRYTDFSYYGCDVSEVMIEAAGKRHASRKNARFFAGAEAPQVADFALASGIFNVCLDADKSDWQAYIEATLEKLDAGCTRGFAFNCLTLYSDAEKMRDTLYYADPLALFDLCKRRYSPHVALLHDYGLYEFTMLVRKIP